MAGNLNPRRPSFLVIVADDLGFSDCGCFGSEIRTPNIDALAQELGALRFSGFHVAAACSPTRSMLMSGTDHHIAGLGQLQEFTRRSPAHIGQPGHEGYLHERVVSLPGLLQDGGYHTLMSGKWHQGLKPEHHPIRRGFDRSFALLPGCANHYNWEPQYDNPMTEPIPFMETATRALHVENDKFLMSLPTPWYSSDGYTDKLISYLEERTDQDAAKPFFAYLPFSAPHWPLQAPDENVAKYRGIYKDGPSALRQKRLKNLEELGLVEKGVKPHPIVAPPGEQGEWESLDEDTRTKSSRAMEVYAGMVDRMDWNIGRVIQYLKDTGEYENTTIFFMSDNGAEGASYEAQPMLADSLLPHIKKYYDNSLDNIGRGNSFVWYGSRWAQAATAPSRLYKMFSTEGGCRVPLITKLPKQMSSNTSGTISGAFCTVMDIVPTILEMAQLQHPAPSYKGRKIAPLRGRSWLPFLEKTMTRGSVASDGKVEHIHDKDYVAGFEIAGSGALRRGDYKITYVPEPKGPQRWELFNVADDPGETKDLRDSMPELFSELFVLWEQYRIEVGVVGLTGEYSATNQAVRGEDIVDEFTDPYAWIKYIGKPEITPEVLKKNLSSFNISLES